MFVLRLVVKLFRYYQKNDIVLNDKSFERIKILRSNLKRLNFNAKILNEDLQNLKIIKNMIT